MATKNETVDDPQEPTAETGQLDSSELEAVVGGNDPAPPLDTDTVHGGLPANTLMPPPGTDSSNAPPPPPPA